MIAAYRPSQTLMGFLEAQERGRSLECSSRSKMDVSFLKITTRSSPSIFLKPFVSSLSIIMERERSRKKERKNCCADLQQTKGDGLFVEGSIVVAEGEMRVMDGVFCVSHLSMPPIESKALTFSHFPHFPDITRTVCFFSHLSSLPRFVDVLCCF